MEATTLEQQQARVKTAYSDSEFEINGTKYEFDRPPFRTARTVFAYLTSIQNQIARRNFSFVDTEEFKRIEKIINRFVLVEGVQLEKEGMSKHWDTHCADYVGLILMAVQVFSYPFMDAKTGG